MDINTLVFSGGGVSGFSQMGFIQELDDQQLCKNVRNLVASSIGSVVATCWSVGISGNKMLDWFLNVNHDVLKIKDLSLLFTDFGLDDGEIFIAVIVDLLLSCNVSPLLTFNDIASTYNKNLYITGTNLKTHDVVYFSKKEGFGDMKVLDAIRISISIPLVLTSVKYQGENYVDGGVLDNYPMSYAIKLTESLEDLQHKIIGCRTQSWVSVPITNLETYFYNLAVCTIRKNKNQVNFYTVDVSTNGISSFQFGITRDERLELFSSAMKQTKAYLTTTRKQIQQTLLRKRRRSL